MHLLQNACGKSYIIEWKSKNPTPDESWVELWVQAFYTADEFDFNHVIVRINGVIYTKNTKEFEAVFNKEKTWQALYNYSPPSLNKMITKHKL